MKTTKALARQQSQTSHAAHAPVPQVTPAPNEHVAHAPAPQAARATPAAPPTAATSTRALGFWIYLMTDCVLFAALFATYAIMRRSTFGGPPASELFDLSGVLAETLILLTSSLVAGMAVVMAHYRRERATLILLGLTFALGTSFLVLELSEFAHLVATGNSWQRSGFLSAFFTLVGTHGLHIASGLIWAGVLLGSIASRGLTAVNIRRLTLFSMFWHFLDVIWIFIFTIVYLMGALNV